MIRIPLLLLAIAAMALTAPPIEHNTADVNGVKLHYAKSGKGKLMLFLHGFPEFWYGWKHQLEEFGRDHQAVAPDMRGYNLSSKPAEVEQYAIPLLVEDVRALGAHLGADAKRKFILVGHDWGGVVAWVYAMAHPDTVEKLVIVNAPHPAIFQRELRGNPAQQKASAYMLMFRGPEAEKTLSANNYQLLVDAVLTAGLKQGAFTDADKMAYLEAWSQPGALTGGLNYYRAAQVGPPAGTEAAAAAAPGSPAAPAAPAASTAPAAPAPPALAAMKVNVPTLVIWGEKDTALLTGNLDGLDAYVPQLSIKRIPEGTHWVVHEKPSEVNRYIREFIAK